MKEFFFAFIKSSLLTVFLLFPIAMQPLVVANNPPVPVAQCVGNNACPSQDCSAATVQYSWWWGYYCAPSGVKCETFKNGCDDCGCKPNPAVNPPVIDAPCGCYL